MRATTPGSTTPSPTGADPSGSAGVFVMVVADLHVLQDADRVRREHPHTEVRREQVAGDTLLVDATELDVDSLGLLGAHAGVVQADHPLLLPREPASRAPSGPGSGGAPGAPGRSPHRSPGGPAFPGAPTSARCAPRRGRWSARPRAGWTRWPAAAPRGGRDPGSGGPEPPIAAA